MDWQTLFSHYGYLLLFLILLIEGQPFIIFAGFLVSLGLFKFGWVILAGWPALVIGDTIFYSFAFRYGRLILNKCGKFLFLTPARIEKLEGFFQKHDKRVIFFSKFIYGLGRNTLIVAGMLKYPRVRIFKYNVVGCLGSMVLYTSLGYLLGHSYLFLNRLLKGVGFVIIIMVVVAIVFERLKLWRLFGKINQNIFNHSQNNHGTKYQQPNN